MNKIRKRGNKYYYRLEFPKIGNKRKQFERVGGSTKKECQNALLQAEKELNKYGCISTKSNILYSDFIDIFTKEHINRLKENTKYNYKYVLKNYILPYFGNYRLFQINKSMIKNFLYDLPEKLSKATKKLIFVVLKKSLNLAVENNFLQESPANNIKFSFDTSIKKENDYIFDIAEIQEILNIFDIYKQIPIMIGAYTGLRIGEILALTWENIDFENSVIKIFKTLIKIQDNKYKFSIPKTETSIREIAIPQILFDFLKELKQVQLKDKLYFGNKYKSYYLTNENIISENENKREVNFICRKKDGSFWNNSNIYKISKQIKKKLNRDFHFHLLRHFNITYLLLNGANLKSVQMHAGHANASTTLNIYSHSSKFEEKKLAKFF